MMYELNNKKPESKQRQADDTVAHALITFAQSLAYSGVEAPVRGAVQIVDHAFGTSIDNKVQSKFDQVGVHPLETAQFGSLAWDAQQLGNAIGMTVPMWLARKTIVGKTEQAFAKTAATEERLVAGLQQTGIANNAIREAKLSATTGFVFGAALTPTDGKDSSDKFWTNRVKQGLNGFTTFGAMGYSSSLSSRLLGRAADSLESTSLQAAFKSPMKAALRSSLVQGAIGGVPGGIVQAQLSAMESGKPLATLQDIKENVVSMSIVGGVMGSVGLFKKTLTKTRETNNENNSPLSDKTPFQPTISPANNFDSLKPSSVEKGAAQTFNREIGAKSPHTQKSESDTMPHLQIFSDGSSRAITAPDSFIPLRPEAFYDIHVDSKNRETLKFLKERIDSRAAVDWELRYSKDLSMRIPHIRPALDAHITKQIDILEIGSHADISVPKILGNRIRAYLSVDPEDLDPSLSKLWADRLLRNGLSTDNKWRVAGFDNRLPASSESQDVIFRNCITSGLPGMGGFDEVLFGRAMQEAQRVLRPSGLVIFQPFLNDNSSAESLVMKHFHKVKIHAPNELELNVIAKGYDERGGPGTFDKFNRVGYFRSLIAFK